MSWGRVNHPSEVFEVGDEVTVKVLKYNADTERVSLGLKQTMEDPWNVATDTYVAGKKVKGKVVSLTDYGAFIALDRGVSRQVLGGVLTERLGFGPMCLITDMAAIIVACSICDRYGIDTISVSTTIAFAIECYERGIITKEDTDGIDFYAPGS